MTTQQERSDPVALSVYVIRTRASEIRRSRDAGVARLRDELRKDDKAAGIRLARFETIDDEYEPEQLVGLSSEKLRELVDVAPPEKEESTQEGQPDGRAGPPVCPPFSRVRVPLYVKQASNALKHFAALQRAAEAGASSGGEAPASTTTGPSSPSSGAHLIVEDDVLFDPRSLRGALGEVLREAPGGWEMMVLGHAVTPPPASLSSKEEGESSSSSRRPRFERIDDFFARSGTRSLLACDSYAVTPRGAAKLLGGFLPIRFPTHVHMAWRVGGYARRPSATAEEARPLPPYVDAYVVTPNAFLDGSKVGTHVSALAVNNRLIWNRRYMALESLLLPRYPRGVDGSSFALPELPPAQAEAVEKILASMEFRDHPDVQHLAAVFYARQGQHRKAAQLLDRARATYEAHRCTMNRDSRILNDLCDIHRYLQDDAAEVPPT